MNSSPPIPSLPEEGNYGNLDTVLDNHLVFPRPHLDPSLMALRGSSL